MIYVETKNNLKLCACATKYYKNLVKLDVYIIIIHIHIYFANKFQKIHFCKFMFLKS